MTETQARIEKMLKKAEPILNAGKKPMTNEEYIRSLTTEQLAEWFLDHMDCIGCPASQEKCLRYYDACKEVMMEWLKQPHQ